MLISIETAVTTSDLNISACVLCSHSLLDAKINSVLSVCHDPVILNAVQAIIQNMICSEDTSQQQLHYLQSCGFGGLWRFAGPFTKVIVIVHEDGCVVACDHVQSGS
jgi:neurofibromin 1